MKKSINIFTNLNSFSFFNKILSEYNLTYKTINDLFIPRSDNNESIIIYNYIKNEKINFNDIKGNYLLLTNNKTDLNITNENIFLINKTLIINDFKYNIKKFIDNINIKHDDISIIDKKLINLENNKFCFLTDIEKEILVYLIKSKNSNKIYIKENVLNLKLNIETNSVDSHLTRIRKKFEKVKSRLRIQSRNDNLSIISS